MNSQVASVQQRKRFSLPVPTRRRCRGTCACMIMLVVLSLCFKEIFSQCSISWNRLGGAAFRQQLLFNTGQSPCWRTACLQPVSAELGMMRTTIARCSRHSWGCFTGMYAEVAVIRQCCGNCGDPEALDSGQPVAFASTEIAPVRS